MVAQALRTDSILETHLRAGAELPVLLMATAHLTGDFSILKPEWRPTPVFGKLHCNANSREAIVAECALRLERVSTKQAPRLTFDALHRIAVWAVGPHIEPFIPLLMEELVFDADPRRPVWSKNEVAPGRPFSVAVIGGGESGIVMAARLKQAGVDFTLYEKNAELGGTWLENRYPGCRVDINSYVYSYASAPHVWPEYFGQQPEVLQYLQDFARGKGVYDHAMFDTRIASAAWDDKASVWNLSIDHNGQRETRTHQAVIYAVGQLNRPALPAIPGIEEFAGPAFHSAQWRHDVDMAGRKVGVVGTGASACQFTPQIAKTAAAVTVFARTTTWLLPTPELHEAVPASAQWLMRNLLAYLQWYRASMLMMQGPGLLDRITHDPAFAASETAISEANDGLRAGFQNWMEPQIADRPDLHDAVIPTSPVGSKRILRDNGSWIRTLKRDNVRVERGGIARIVAEGIVTQDGVTHPLDVLVYGTGFEAQKFLFPIEIKGADGRDLHGAWAGDARSYLGGTVPGFPNMFMMYGPNTNLVVHGGSMILFSELSAKYILDGLLSLLERAKDSFEVTQEAHDVYNLRVDETNATRAWGYSKVNSWYKNKKGRVTQNYPFTIAEYWQRTNRFDRESYQFR